MKMNKEVINPSLYKAVFDKSLDGILVADVKTRKFMFANPQICKITGYPLKELLKLNIDKIHPKKDLPYVLEQFKKQIQGKITLIKGIPILRKDKKIVYCDVNSKIIKIEKQELMLGFFKDVTERKKAEEALKESEANFKNLFENISSGVAVYEAIDNGKDFIFTNFDKTGERIDNIKREDVIGKSVLKVFPGLKKFGLFKVFQRVWNTGNPENYPVSFYKDKRLAGWRENYVYKLSSGRIVAVYNDVTKQKKAEEEIQSQAKFPSENPHPVMRISKDGILLYTNEAAFALEKKLIEKGWRKTFKKIYENNQITEQEIPVGDRLHSFTTAPIKGADYINVYGKDITETKKAEKTIRENEERYKTTFENTGTAMIIVEGDTTISLANHQFELLAGYSKEEIEGKMKWTKFVIKEELKRMKEYHNNRRKKGEKVPNQYEFHFVDKKGNMKNVFLTVNIISGTKKSVASLIDITERKKADEAIIVEASHRSILMEQSRDGIVVLKQDGSVYESNQQFAMMLGFSPEEVSHLHVWDWEFQFTREQVQGMLRDVDETGDHFETKHRRKDGTIYDVEISTNASVFAGEKLIFCVCRDITKRKQMEQETKNRNEELERFNKLAVGREFKMIELKRRIKELEEKVKK